MVILNSVSEKVIHDAPDTDKSGSPYVCLVDNEEKMMLILKRDFDEIGGSNSMDEHSSIQKFITEKMQSLLERISDNCPLSLREIEVLNYAAIGNSNKQIGNIIGLSESTIKNHLSNTLKKLHANDRTHAVTLALCHGWLDAQNISNNTVNEETVVGAID